MSQERELVTREVPESRIGRNAGVLLDRVRESTYRFPWIYARFHRGFDMRGTRHRSTSKSLVAILCAACFLTMSLGSVTRAGAADDWETWPKKSAEPVIEQKPVPGANGAVKAWEPWPKNTAVPVIEQKPVPGANGAADAAVAAGKKTETGMSYKTIGGIALGIAAVIGIAIAAGGSGDGGGGTVTNPGHQ